MGVGTTVKYVQIPSEEVIYTYKDSIITRDSTVLIPKEYYRDFTTILDTLKLETSTASSKSWVDTTSRVLTGFIESKDNIKYKYITKTEYITRDSIVTVNVPYEVVVEKEIRYVPHIYKVSLYWLLISIFFLIGFLFTKFSKKRFVF